MKRHWKWIGIIILILLVAGAALYGWQRRTRDQQDVMQERGHGPTAMVGRGDIRRTLTVFGAVIPKDEIAFTFNINELLELKAEEGDTVEKGQILAVLNNVQQELTLLQAERALAKARVEGIPTVIREKELRYEIARADYEATILRAPWTGIVTDVGRADGAPGQYQISLLNRTELFIETMIDELDIHQITREQEGLATIDAVPGGRWPVQIVWIGHRAVHGRGGGFGFGFGGEGRTVPITLKLFQPSPEILPGFSARVEIITAEALEVLEIPVGALIEVGPDWQVMVVEEGKPVPRPVEVGLTTGKVAEIISGLEEGEEILLHPIQATGRMLPFPMLPGIGPFHFP